MKIGFIGLGRMGHHVAANLLKAGHQVTVWNRSQAPVQALVEKGAVAAKSPEDAVKGDAVFSMLSNDQVMRDVGLAGPLLEKAAKGLIHVNLATISVAFAKELAEAHKKAGLSYISAPVFGRPEMAEAAALVLVAGGDAAALKPCSRCSTRSAPAPCRWTKPEGQSVQDLRQLHDRQRAGSHRRSLCPAAQGRRGSGPFHDVLAGRLFTGAVFKAYGAMILNRAYEPAGFALSLGLKDVNLARSAAQGLGVEMPTAELPKKHYDEAVAWGWQDKDWAAIGEVPAKKAGV